MPLSFDLAVIAGIPGWLTSREAQLLHGLAQRCTGRGVIVEIGSWKGRSTICLASGSLAGSGIRVFAIDPFTGSSEHGKVDTFAEFEQNIQRAGIASIVTPKRMPSAQAAQGWNEPVELLWIDGAHEEEFVCLDYASWEPHLIEGGVIAFHDSTDPGPWKVIHECLFRGTGFRYIRFIDGITYATKGPATPLRNRIMMMLCDLKFALWKIRNRWRKWRK